MKCTIQSQKKQATLVVKRLVLYQNCKLIHAQGRSGQDYYLIFHKNRYINTIKVTELKIDSFISKAIEQGLIVSAPHHAIYSLINQQVFSCLPLDKMVHHAENHPKQLEQVIILSYFDQYIAKEKIINLFIETFRNHRRNGKLQQAYQVLTILEDYAPENQFARDILTSLTFQGYQSDNQEYFAFNPLQSDILEKTYLKNKRHLEISILSTVNLLNEYSDDQWQLFHHTLSDYPIDIQAKTLFQLLKQKPSLIEQKTFAKALLKYANVKQFLSIVLKPEYPHSIDPTIFIEQLEQASQDEHLAIFNKKQKPFIDRITSFPIEDKEKATRLIIESAIQITPIDEVLKWLDAFEDTFSFYNQLLTIKKLVENPDQQEKLAEFYQRFNHRDGAIECLKWEAELYPTKESVHKKLIKLLKETNQNEEADAYQEQWIQQTKYST
ncbi:hypothetical protein ACS127_18265 [Amphibacillus sp. Q70]|uniref:hypothetical protein n=1 Tax=Amphibacillus sp. Q70 TaxID=3453416 RepID=UPI003F87D631